MPQFTRRTKAAADIPAYLEGGGGVGGEGGRGGGVGGVAFSIAMSWIFVKEITFPVRFFLDVHAYTHARTHTINVDCHV